MTMESDIKERANRAVAEQQEYEKMKKERHKSRWRAYKRFWMIVRFVLYFGLWFSTPIVIASLTGDVRISILSIPSFLVGFGVAVIGPGNISYIGDFLTFPKYGVNGFKSGFDAWYAIKFEGATEKEHETPGQKYRRLKKEEEKRLRVIELYDRMKVDPDFRKAFLEL